MKINGDSLRSQLLAAIEAQLGRDLAALEVSGSLREAVNYVLFPGGKRIRPILAMMLCADLEVDPIYSVNLFTPLELIHIASLVHDDLPALDNDDYRRGRASCHKKFSEPTAILTGDLMVAQAISLLAKSDFSDDPKLKLIAELSSAFVRLCHGQQCDIDGASGREILKTHALKTGALFGAACASGAIVAKQSAQIVDCARQLGVSIGIYFQAIDDYIDNQDLTEEKGRGVGSDQRNHRHTVATDLCDSSNTVLTELRAQIDGYFVELSSACHGNSGFIGARQIVTEIESALTKSI